MTALPASALATRYDALNAVLFWPAGGSGRLRQCLVDTLDIRRGHRALELGCGTGQVTARLLDAGARVVGVDALPDMLDGARRRAPAATLIEGDIIDTDVGGDYHRVVLSFVLHNFHAAERVAVLRRAASALAPNGRIGVLDWAEPDGRVRAWLWRQVLTQIEPSTAVVEVLAGQLDDDIAAAGLRIDRQQPVAGSRVQILVCSKEFDR